MSNEQYEAGLAVRKEVLGAEYVERAMAGADDFNRDFQTMVTEYCWGGPWTRDDLNKRTRSLLNLAMLSALNRPDVAALKATINMNAEAKRRNVMVRTCVQSRLGL